MEFYRGDPDWGFPPKRALDLLDRIRSVVEEGQTPLELHGLPKNMSVDRVLGNVEFNQLGLWYIALGHELGDSSTRSCITVSSVHPEAVPDLSFAYEHEAIGRERRVAEVPRYGEIEVVSEGNVRRTFDVIGEPEFWVARGKAGSQWTLVVGEGCGHLLSDLWNGGAMIVLEMVRDIEPYIDGARRRLQHPNL